MSDAKNLKVDQRAELRFPDFTAHFDTVSEAIDHWRKLEPEQQEHAVLACEGGDVYQPPEIPLLNLVTQ